MALRKNVLNVTMDILATWCNHRPESAGWLVP